MPSSPKRFYTIHNGRQLYEVIDLDAIIYIKLLTGDLNLHNQKVKISHKIILNNGAELSGHEFRKAEGGKPVWSERLVHGWQKWKKQEAEV